MQPKDKDTEIDHPPGLTAIAKRLNEGEVIAFPTETFFGLLARIDRPKALRRIFALKGRPPERALPVIVSNNTVAKSLWSLVPAESESLINHFWPGPLTIILPAHASIDMLITGGGDTVGVRVPGRVETRELCALAGGALVATSANPADHPPARSCEDIARYFGDKVFCHQTPPLAPSKSSTVLQMTQWPPLILRAGEISRAELTSALGIEPDLRN